MKKVQFGGMMLLIMVLMVGISGTAFSSEAKLLRGNLWQKMSNDEKVAFIWGAGQVITIEQELMKEYPELVIDNFSKKVVEGMADVSMNQIVLTVDDFYKNNPDKLATSVMRIIWDELIKPNLKTGIAGRPLK